MKKIWLKNRAQASLPKPDLIRWKIIADQFYRSSELIYEECFRDQEKAYLKSFESIDIIIASEITHTPGVDFPYFLMIGYCLENMIKGLLIEQRPLLTSGRKLSQDITNHNLPVLSAKLKIDFTDEEKDLLIFLYRNIEWLAKYPIPKDSYNSIVATSYILLEVRKLFKAIYGKLSNAMTATGALPDFYNSYPVDKE